MRLLYLITRADKGGGQVHLLDLISGLKDQFPVNVGVGEAGYLTEKCRDWNIPFHILPNLVREVKPARDIRAFFEVTKLIKRVRPTIVHAHTSKAGVIGRLAARKCGVPSIFTAHTWAFNEGTSWKWKIYGIPSERLTSKFTNKIITVSEVNRQLAIKYGIASADKLVTVHNGVPDTPYRAWPSAPGTVKVIMVARFVDQKDPLTLIRAFAGLQSPARLIFVGDGPLEESIKEEARRLGVFDRTEFLGNRNDVDQILSRAHVLVLATKFEGFPLTILEGMRAGLPVIASDVGGVKEAVIDGETGFTVSPGSPAALRDRVEQLVKDSNLRASMGVAGRNLYEKHFTLERMISKTISVYEDV